MAVELSPRVTLPDLVHFRQSAVLNTGMVAFIAQKLTRASASLESFGPVYEAMDPQLRDRARNFWSDGSFELCESSVLAFNAGVLFEPSIEPLVAAMEDGAVFDVPVLDYPSETPEDLATMRRRIATLRDDPERRAAYIALLRDIWATIQRALPNYDELHEAEVRAVRGRLESSGSLREALPSWCMVFDERIGNVVDAELEAGNVTYVPLVATPSGQCAYAFPGTFVIAIAHDMDATREQRRQAAERAAEQFKVLSDPTRLQLLYALIREPASVTKLAAVHSLSQPTVSAHVKQLRDAGLVEPRRQGALTVYYVTGQQVREWIDSATKALFDF